MSTFVPYRLTCRCGSETTVELAYGIHITRLPWARRQILDGTFQVFTCPACGAPTAVTRSTVYTDFDRNEYVAVEPSLASNWEDIRDRNDDVFDSAFLAGPPAAAEMGTRFRKRCVFGFPALREKLLIWDAALDDLVIEGVKGQLCERLDLHPDEVMFRLGAILPGGHLTFARFDPPPPPPPGVGVHQAALPCAVDVETVPASDYRDRVDRRGEILDEYPWLRDDWLVDLYEGCTRLPPPPIPTGTGVEAASSRKT